MDALFDNVEIMGEDALKHALSDGDSTTQMLAIALLTLLTACRDLRAAQLAQQAEIDWLRDRK